MGVDGLPIMFIGSQFKGYAVQSGFDERYRDTHSRQYSLSTVGNDCKWQSTHSSPQGLNLTACVSAKLYADSVEQAFRGHNLCWGNDNPRWLLNADFSADQLRATLREHVTGVMRGVASETGSAPLAWDVVNEACGTAISANGSFFKPSLWYPKVPDFVDVAFIAARKAASSSLAPATFAAAPPQSAQRSTSHPAQEYAKAPRGMGAPHGPSHRRSGFWSNLIGSGQSAARHFGHGISWF